MRFGFKTLKDVAWGPELEIHDAQIFILAKDGTKYLKTIEGDWESFMDEEPYATNTVAIAHDYFDENEWYNVKSVEDDEPLTLPRCNISLIKVRATNKRMVQPIHTLRGFKDWSLGEWCLIAALLFTVSVFSFMLYEFFTHV